MLITVRCTHCLETFADVTKEINTVAVVCPCFYFLWRSENEITKPGFYCRIQISEAKFDSLAFQAHLLISFLVDEIAYGWIEFLHCRCLLCRSALFV